MIKIYDTNKVTLNTKDKYCTENIEIQVDDSNLDPKDIRKGTMILGVVGTAVMGGVTPPTGTKVITTNGTHEVSRYEYAEVNVAGSGGITPEGTIELTSNGDHDVTNYATAKVNVPNVIPEEYIIPEGTKEITSNGLHDAAAFANVNVNVPIPDGYILPSGNFAITENGDYNIRDKETVSVNVAGGGGGDETALFKEYVARRGTNLDSFFKNMSKPVDEFLAVMDTSKVITMDGMFSGSTITSIPQLNTDSLKNASSMFQSARVSKVDLTTIDNLSGTNYLFAYTSINTIIIRRFTKIPTINTNWFNSNPPFGTNKSGKFYVPYDIIPELKKSTNWASLVDTLRPIYKVDATGSGTVSETLNGTDTIWTATANAGATFTGWYRGFVESQQQVNSDIPAIGPTSVESYTDNIGMTPEYGFVLGDDGYYKNTNQAKGNSFCASKFNFTKTNENEVLFIDCLQSSENGYDFGYISKLNTTFAVSSSGSGDIVNQLVNLKGLTAYSLKIELDSIAVGESFFITIAYRKDGSGDKGDDTVKVKLELVQTVTTQIPILDELYSTDETINIGKVDVMTMEPLPLVAVFEEA